MIKYSLCKKCIGMFLQNNIKICLLTSVHLLFRKLSICMFFCVHHFKYHSRERVYFKFSMCVCYWILSRQYAQVFDQKLLSQKNMSQTTLMSVRKERVEIFAFVVRDHPAVDNLLSEVFYCLLELVIFEHSVIHPVCEDPGTVGGWQALIDPLDPKGSLIWGSPHEMSISVVRLVVQEYGGCP